MRTTARNGSTYPAPAIGLIVLLLTLFLIYVSAKVLYVIKIENQTIFILGLFKKRRIENHEIKSINLFSIEDFYWTSGSETIGIRIELENGGKVVIADPFYINIGLIKQELVESFKNKIKFPQIPKSVQTNLESDLVKFAGNPNTSFNGLFLYLLTIGVFILLLQLRNLSWAYLIIIFPIAMFYYLFGSQLHYFLVSNKRLVVKNHFLFWINKTYNIEDIKALNFERPYRRSRALRISYIDYKSKLYCAGSLRDKHWHELKEKIESLKIYFIE
ncbi:MAG: hypothetical protein WDO19_11910 [Bacteroidota bacterium]